MSHSESGLKKPTLPPLDHPRPPVLRDRCRALVCETFGSFDSLCRAVIEIPSPGPGEVAIRVSRAGVSFAHALVVAGKYQRRPPLPFVPGTECTGVIEAVGEGVEGLWVGQRVCAVLDWGGYAEVALARVEGVFPLPDALADLENAVALPISYGTSHGALRWRGQLERGQTLLVLGAAGGVGLAACEIGRALGAKVLAVVSGSAKKAALADRGFDGVIDVTTATLGDAVAELTAGEGVDLVFDPVGGASFDQALRCLCDGGRLLTIGYAAGEIPSVGANILLLKNIGVLGFNWGEYVGWGKTDKRRRYAAKVQATLSQLMAWWERGLISPTVSASFPLDDFALAMEAVQSRRSIGRVALIPAA